MSSALLKVTFFLTLGSLRLTGSSLLIRKCCRDGESLLLRYTSCFNQKPPSDRNANVTKRLVSDVITQEHPEIPLWMDPDLTPLSPTSLKPVSSFLSDQNNGTYIEYGSKLPCDHQVIVRSTDRDHNILHNGSLIFRTYGGDNVSFPPDSYCADLAVSDTVSFVYLLCPCENRTCVKSCCGSKKMLSTEWNRDTCVDIETGLSKYSLANDQYLIFYSTNTKPYHCSVDENETLINFSTALSWKTFNYISLSDKLISPTTTDKSVCHNIRPTSRRGKKVYIHETCVRHEGESEGVEFYYSINACSATVLTLALFISVVVGEMQKNKIIASHIICVLVTEVSSALFRNKMLSYDTAAHVYVQFYREFFSIAATLWINALCIDLALSFRSIRVQNPGIRRDSDRKFLYYNIYAWGATTVRQLICTVTVGGGTEEEVIQYIYIPLIIGIINFILLSYTVINIVIQQRETRNLNNGNSARHSAVSCFNKHRRLLVHVNLLLLMGPPSAYPAIIHYLYGPVLETGVVYDTTKLLRAVSILVFVLLKPEIYSRLLQKIKSYLLVCARKGVQRSEETCGMVREETRL